MLRVNAGLHIVEKNNRDLDVGWFSQKKKG